LARLALELAQLKSELARLVPAPELEQPRSLGWRLAPAQLLPERLVGLLAQRLE
jgi:hypothetical protein